MELVSVWVDVGLMPTVLAGRAFRGWLFERKNQNAAVVHVWRSRVGGLDCATGDVTIRSVEDVGPVVPPSVFEYSLSLIRRLRPHVGDWGLIPRAEYDALVSEAARFLDPLDGYGTELKAKLEDADSTPPPPTIESTAAEQAAREFDPEKWAELAKVNGTANFYTTHYCPVAKINVHVRIGNRCAHCGLDSKFRVAVSARIGEPM